MLVFTTAQTRSAYTALQDAANVAIEAGELEYAEKLLAVLKSIRDLPTTNNAQDGLDAKEIELLKTKGLIFAVKELRTRTGMGLKDAKEIVDRFIVKHHIILPTNY